MIQKIVIGVAQLCLSFLSTPFISWPFVKINLSATTSKLFSMDYHILLTDLWYQMYLPPGFDKSKKYPLLIDV